MPWEEEIRESIFAGDNVELPCNVTMELMVNMLREWFGYVAVVKELYLCDAKEENEHYLISVT